MSGNKANRAVFLDRDGVINAIVYRDGRPYPPATLDAMRFLDGVEEAIQRLKQKGYKIIVATNQPDVAKGIQKLEIVEKMHERIYQQLHVDDIKVCYHVDADNCPCRKPKPGMLLEAAAQWSLDLKNSYMVGDRWRDVDAGKAAGCKTVWIVSSYNEKKAENADIEAESLLEAASIILNQEKDF